ncbi:beta family protein [Streptomyces sp. GMY02]|uniref:beta family protein n=1 Tax=Streptomyces sp. GMY02 TaxID=1333528 RepID=UPI001C2BAC89|nr:beta family protein [Streptomyces sp. GMY02]QXE35649.1 beta family protein [Streptomyces sp. GMY02]
MGEPLYVPVLPTTRAARTAYTRLDRRVRQRIAPLWTVVPRLGPERARGLHPVPDPEAGQVGLHTWLTPRIDGLVAATGDHGGWVDATHVERLVDASATGLWNLMTSSRLRLITGPERDIRHQRHAADLAFLSGRGLGIRVLLDNPPDEPRSTQLLALIERLRLPPSQLDLLLDVGPAHDPVEAGKTALMALDLLGPLVPWRTVVLTSGSFPRVLENLATQPRRIIRRHDWDLYRSVRDARPALSSRVIYGDYSVEHVFSANMAAVRHRGPGWGLLRYTAPDTFLVAQVPTRGPGHVSRARAGARWIVESDSFRAPDGIHGSEGERWLHASAHGDGPDGSGNAEKWMQVGHIQHMNFVVDQLAGLG